VYRFRNEASFYGGDLLARSPTLKLEDHPLSAVRDCLFNIFAATLRIGGRSAIRNLRKRHAVVTGTHLRFTRPFGFKNTRSTVLYLLHATHTHTHTHTHTYAIRFFVSIQSAGRPHCQSEFKLLTPNVNCSGRTAPLTSKVAFYIVIQQIQVLNILNMVYTLRFFSLFKMQFVS